ncbi:MAG: T9SS type A sorting domain-containing protein [Bacteroidales bacterium]
MKKTMTTITIIAWMIITGSSYAQDTIAAWIFPEYSADSLVDVSIETNANRFLSCEYGTYGTPAYYALTIDYAATGADGGTDKCAKTTGWENGADSIYWMVKFRTPGYENLKVYSKQKSEMATPGPRDFVVQYKMPGSSSPWNDLSGGTIVCTDDWSAGSVNGIDLPAECNDMSSNISLRWIVTSNTDINGNPVQADGSSLIDDIVITGTLITNSIDSHSAFQTVLYSNPGKGSITIGDIEGISKIEVIESSGKVIYQKAIQSETSLVISDLGPGVYFVNLYEKSKLIRTLKALVN